MNIYTVLILGAFLISMVCGFISTPVILNYCKEKRLYDIPNGRKVHKNPIPRLGGISFMPSMLLAFFIALFFVADNTDKQFVRINLWSVYFLVSLLIIYFVGIIDDLIGLNANIKFVVQIIAASIMPLSGLYINNLYGLFGIHEIPYWLGACMTVFAIVFICNAMNLIDGIDGLCAGLSEIALGGFLLVFFEEGVHAYCVLIAGLMGVLIAYSYFNLWGKAESNRKIFMGDSGSLTLGFILGFLFVKYTMDNPSVMAYNAKRMCTAMSLLIVPTFDVVRVVLYRLRNHRPIFDADKCHIHHRLMQTNLSMHQSLLAILALALVFIIINSMLYPLAGFTLVLITDIATYTLFHISLTVVISHNNKKEGQVA